MGCSSVSGYFCRLGWCNTVLAFGCTTYHVVSSQTVAIGAFSGLSHSARRPHVSLYVPSLPLGVNEQPPQSKPSPEASRAAKWHPTSETAKRG